VKADSYRFSLAGMIAALCLMCAWGIWLFGAQVPIYKISSSARVIPGENRVSEFPGQSLRVRVTYERYVDAEFTVQALSAIKSGQKASFIPDGDAGKKTGAIPAVITDAAKIPDKKTGKVRITLLCTEKIRAHIRDGLTGQVKAEVDYATPWILVMRAAGMVSDTPEPVSEPRS
jgi:hypothetical protein